MRRVDRLLAEEPRDAVDDLVLRTAAAFTSGDFTSAALWAHDAISLARAGDGDSDLRSALCIGIVVATAIEWTSAADDAVVELGRITASDRTERFDRLDRFLVAEAALSTGDLATALAVLTVDGALPDPDARDFPVVALQPARALLFQGRPQEAQRHLDAALEIARRDGDELWERLVESVAVFAAMQLGQPLPAVGTARLTRRRAGFLTDARLAYLAYAAAGAGDLFEAERILRLLDAPAFACLQIGDRALATDILVQAALIRGDIGGAEELAAGLLPLAAHPVAATLVEQVFARVDLARGDLSTSIQRAEVARARAEVVGAYREAANARLLRARALADDGRRADARDEFSALLLQLDEGDAGIAGQLRRTMRELGLRSRPALGAGWDALSDREREVAVLVARGLPNRTIAHTLFLSERTVEGYVSRVLHVLGAPTRAGVPARVPRDDEPDERPALTARQGQTASLVARGLTNAEIAAELGVSVKTVEKHVSDVLARWGLESRTQIARALR